LTVTEASATFPALGSTAVVAVTEPGRLDTAIDAVKDTVAAFDDACSRFREDSELSALNARAGSPVRVSALLCEAIQAALRAAWLTDGDVDPTVGEALIALGYDRDFDAIPSLSQNRISIASVPGWRAIQLDPDDQTVTLARDVRLDLGATAKALAADRAASAATDATRCGVIVGLGGDISIAGPAPEPGWPVRVTDDHRAGVEAPGQWIRLRSGGLATSSTTARRWQLADGFVHHLVSPASARPAAGPWRTATVAAASCLDANIASTAAIVRGAAAVSWLEQLGLPSRLVGSEGRATHVAGWPSEGDDLG
jgi:thiamine biosynthesis lipoprotein